MMRSNSAHAWNRVLFLPFWLVPVLMLAAWVPILEASDWVTFQNETTTRLITPVKACSGGSNNGANCNTNADCPGGACDSLGATDPQEKDYAWEDVDQDGDIDLVVVRKQLQSTAGRRRNVLFMNEGGILVDRTVEYASEADDGGQGFLDPTNDRDITFADVNGDGWMDMITAVTYGNNESVALPKTLSHPRVYINKGATGGVWQGFRYEQARIPQFPITPNFCGVAAGDVTGDGRPDLYFADYFNNLEDRLLINNGSGTFTDQTAARTFGTMLSSTFSTHTLIEDMNGDGAMDILKDSALGPYQVSVAYNNPANLGFFTSPNFDIVYTGSSYFIQVGDLNNDDLLDLVVVDDGTDAYLLNQGNAGNGQANLFQCAQCSFPGSGGFGGNARIADLNKDSWNDVLISDIDVDLGGCGGDNLTIYRNNGNPPNVTFTLDFANIPVGMLTNTHDIAIFDINSDTWPDMVVGRCTGTQVWIQQAPESLVFTYPDGLPATIPPGQTFGLPVAIQGLGAAPEPATGKQFVSIDGGPFVESPMKELQPDVYELVLPAADCTSQIRFYVTAENANGNEFVDPPTAPVQTHLTSAVLGTELVLDEAFEEASAAWSVTNMATSGGWDRVDPIATFFPTGSQTMAQPENDFSAGAKQTDCYVTGQYPGFGDASVTDVDGGPTILTSPVLDLAGGDAIISYARWQFSNVGGASVPDSLITEVTANGSVWVQVHETFSTNSQWELVSFKVSDYVTPSAAVQVRFVSSDQPNNSVTESGIDDFKVTRIICSTDCRSTPECDDGLFCNGSETCVDNFCEPGAAPCPGLCDEDADQCVECLVDADCSDGLFCNGSETCMAGACQPGSVPCGKDRVCDEITDSCTGCLADGDCDDGLFCNGAETCSGGQCQPGSNPCPGQQCDESGDQCVQCLVDGDCDDGLFCNGPEACRSNLCQPGGDPCPGKVCEENADICIQCIKSEDCDDGVFCNGAEICTAGTCSPGTHPCLNSFCDESSDACTLIVQPKMGEPLPALTGGELQRFAAGQAAFQQVFDPEDGLGPVFNKDSCSGCHSLPLGGSGTITVERFGFADKGSFDPLEHLGGSLRQSEAISDECREFIPPEANVIAMRLTNSTLGSGLVEAIPDARLLALQNNPPAGVSGSAHMVPAAEDPPGSPLRVGRFGWKAQVPTVLTFSGDATLNEMGITNRLFGQENAPNGDSVRLAQCDTIPDPEDGPDLEGFDFIDRVTDFQRFLAAPPQTPRSGMTGETVFNNIGCADCHSAMHFTGPAAEAGIAHQAIKPYSDFLLHDMGALGDGIAQGDASTSEMRTPSLWGVRVRLALLHDGRISGGTFAERMTATIAEHGAPGSEAAASAGAFAALPQAQKDALIAFLDSLGRAEFDHDGDNVIDMDDFHVFHGCYDGSNGSYTPDDPCSISDIDADGDVDGVDFDYFLLAFDGALEDCNANSTPDLRDIIEGEYDTNVNGIPDSCEANCFDRGDVNHDGAVDLFDILCVLDAFQGVFQACSLQESDLAPCAGDNSIDLADVVMILDAYSGQSTGCGPVCE